MSCFWGHLWSVWSEPYEERGVYYQAWGGPQMQYCEVRQRRHCRQCHLIEDRYVKAGPLVKVPEGRKEDA